MAIALRPDPFEPYAELLEYQAGQPRLSGQYGATCAFVGTMRDFNEGDTVRAMTLEHYPGMTENQLGHILDEARRRWTFLDALVIHRVGDILPGQPIVLVAVWSAHRNAAFEACRYLMEELKHRAPFWKKETLAQGERWVERNTEG
ncbi:molybdopterin synthase subunit MoaE [Methylomagnum ishizawai]|uniref:Molybdopterin synthase catalytic subunit n=1 Tax=Methylomagnum ishizawai TaxID=1760988 RepID=A0A1Y6D3H0_9GAMM|nr:molybdenum cofactor biosynthesis protein MoaE [Methylomagnum ishizawai]SMF97146.1 molybdopterin synthase subunit MoaE [Methylomagnum ishizawai]